MLLWLRICLFLQDKYLSFEMFLIILNAFLGNWGGFIFKFQNNVQIHWPLSPLTIFAGSTPKWPSLGWRGLRTRAPLLARLPATQLWLRQSPLQPRPDGSSPKAVDRHLLLYNKQATSQSCSSDTVQTGSPKHTAHCSCCTWISLSSLLVFVFQFSIVFFGVPYRHWRGEWSLYNEDSVSYCLHSKLLRNTGHIYMCY